MGIGNGLVLSLWSQGQRVEVEDTQGLIVSHRDAAEKADVRTSLRLPGCRLDTALVVVLMVVMEDIQ